MHLTSSAINDSYCVYGALRSRCTIIVGLPNITNLLQKGNLDLFVYLENISGRLKFRLKLETYFIYVDCEVKLGPV